MGFRVFSDSSEKTEYAHRKITRIQNTAHNLYQKGFRILPRVLKRYLRHIYSCDIAYEATIAPSALFLHDGFGVVIGKSTIIGEHTKILHQVTIGGRTGHVGADGRTNPTIGKHVLIGSGSTILGPVTIGDYAKIGAGAVVLEDVAPGTTVCGIPAKPVASHSSMPSESQELI